jgi:hypothetical protein
MGGIYCLPISEEANAAAAALDSPGVVEALTLFTPDDLGEERRADAVNEESLTATALVRPLPAAQGGGRRSGIATDHQAADLAGKESDDVGTSTEAFEITDETEETNADIDDDVLAGAIDDILFNTQAFDATDKDTNDAPPNLTQEETADERTSGADGIARIRDFAGEADLKQQVLHPCDNQLINVYGDSIHRNDGRHLDGGVADDDVWQRRYDRVVAAPHPMYNPPKGGLGHRVVSTLAGEFRGVRERKWNSERALIFAACVLRKSPGVIRSRDIKRRVERRLQLWTDGHYDALVQDIVGEAMRGADRGRSNNANEDIIARKYNSMVLDGKLRATVRFATDRGGGGVLLPEDSCTKTGRPVMEVLRSQHPDTRIPNLEDPHCIAFEHYDEVPVEVPTDCTSEDLETLALRMSGGAGPSSFDAVMLRNCLLRYGRASGELREELATWVEWLSNESPPWAAYRALMSRRLVALDIPYVLGKL